MCSAKPWYVLLVLCCVTSAPLALAQNSPAASEDEVKQLRRELEELKAQIKKLQGAEAAPPAAGAGRQAAEAGRYASGQDQPAANGRLERGALFPAQHRRRLPAHADRLRDVAIHRVR
jgi:cell division septum initiation protein DivIVA